MRHFINSRVPRRYARLSRGLTYGGLAIMVLGVIGSFQGTYPQNLIFAAFFLGLIVFQLGVPLRNRWDRTPRADQMLDSALKGLDDRYTVFHYCLGARHALFGPKGSFAITPRGEEGLIEYQDEAWYQTLPRRSALRRGGVRELKGMDRDAESNASKLQRALVKRLDAEAAPSTRPLL